MFNEDNIQELFVKPPEQTLAKVLYDVFGKDITKNKVNYIDDLNALYKKYGMLNINLLQKDGIVQEFHHEITPLSCHVEYDFSILVGQLNKIK